jgi:hypothetical protein
MQIFTSWQLYAIGLAYFVFMSATGALKAPDTSSSELYGWLYRFLNLLAVNAKAVAGARFPAITTPEVKP